MQHTSYIKALIFLDKVRKRLSEKEIINRLSDGDRSVQMRAAGLAGGIAIIPVNLLDGG